MTDVIGVIYDPAPLDAHGLPIGEPVLLEGFHVNVARADMTPELQPFVVTPNRLRRVFAGDDPDNPQWTVALRFEGEAEAIQALGELMQGAGQGTVGL